jgi:phosphohistidine phosphatase
MELILWRHADAEDGSPDAERRLTAKGVRQAQQMAKWLKARLPKDALVLASPARRAQETAQALTTRFETRSELDTGTTARALLKAVGWPRAERTVVVVGHQPVLGETAGLVLTGSALALSVKKGAIWWLARRARDEATVLRAVMSPDVL